MSIRPAHLYNVKHELLWTCPDVLVSAWRSANQQKNMFFLNQGEKNSRKNSDTHVLGTILKGRYQEFFSEFKDEYIFFYEFFCAKYFKL